MSKRLQSGSLLACVSFVLLALCAPVLAAQPPVAHFYGVNEPSSRESLQQNAAHIQLLSPAWFTVDATLALQSTVDPAVVDAARDRHVSLMPLVNNFNFDTRIAHALLADSERQEHLIAALLDACRQHGFSGVQLDIENVPPADRDVFTEFVRQLARAFHRDHLAVTVALPAPLQRNPAAQTKGQPAWVPNEHATGFDYRELGKAADFVSVMTYDQHVTEPGPIAGLPWVEACLRAVLASIPRGKVMLGVALYHRHWSRPAQQQAASYAMTDGPYGDAIQLAAQWNTPISTDPVEREQTFSHNDGSSDHVVWLAGATSIDERLRLVKQYRLRGFSAWRLGQEDGSAWRGPLSLRHKH